MSHQTLHYGHYLRWAHEKLFRMLDPVPEADWTRDTGGSFGNLLETAGHLFWALDVWLDSLDGQQLSDRFPQEKVAGALSLYRSVDQRFTNWVAGLNQQSVAEIRQMPSPSGQVHPLLTGHILQHLVNHSSYHRGQVVDQLKRLGHPVTATDYIFFVLEKAKTGPGK